MARQDLRQAREGGWGQPRVVTANRLALQGPGDRESRGGPARWTSDGYASPACTAKVQFGTTARRRIPPASAGGHHAWWVGGKSVRCLSHTSWTRSLETEEAFKLLREAGVAVRPESESFGRSSTIRICERRRSLRSSGQPHDRLLATPGVALPGHLSVRQTARGSVHVGGSRPEILGIPNPFR